MEPLGARPFVTLVDDDQGWSASVARWLRNADMRTVECRDAGSFLDGLDTSLPDVVCLDLGLPGMSGLQALDAVRRQHPGVPVLVLTAEASAESVVEAMQRGACDYLIKPVDRDRLLSSIERALRFSEERQQSQVNDSLEEVSYAGVIGRSPPMREVFRQVDRVASRDISVLIRGDSGTGKELIARAIHENSRRAGGPFVAINCASIPESLQDSELFGHERGSFTGAHKARAGCFERADALDPEHYPMPIQIDEARFARAAEEALRNLPRSIRDYVEGVPVLVEEFPSTELVSNENVSPQILGIFIGVPRTEASVSQPQADLDRVIRDDSTATSQEAGA